MRLPGFTAEASFGQTGETYHSAGIFGQTAGAISSTDQTVRIIPANIDDYARCVYKCIQRYKRRYGGVEDYCAEACLPLLQS